MEHSFQRYLISKQTVDDRALNRRVFQALRACLPAKETLLVTEVGAGTGTMLRRLIDWGLWMQTDYTLVDESPENMAYAREWLAGWARERGLQMEEGIDSLQLSQENRQVSAHFVTADAFEFIRSQPGRADLLIANAFLDLLPLPSSLPPLFSLIQPGGLAWLTLNFDGASIFEPAIDPALDAQVEMLYHRSMDERLTAGLPSGDSRTGRHLFTYLRQAGAEILEAGASDWVVFPQDEGYPADEAYFLECILDFFKSSLSGHPELNGRDFAAWLAARQAQIDRHELVYIAHQIDFLVKVLG